MDAGLAAVLGALAGSVATIGAAVATGWAQREEARIAARSEHKRERREPRHEVYRQFISEANHMGQQAGVYSSLGAALTPDYFTEDRTRRVHEMARLIEAKATEAALAGPKEITESALKIAQLASQLSGSVSNFRELTDERYQRMQDQSRRSILKYAKEYEASLNNFTLQAQSALDDDGSRK
ncbi:hypothetical protein AB0L26_03340 [Streptomyces nondiastaticus]|uniref:hypothetical protein n=1 Tax=Streptomyces nondiastaticus TaxID=3154512 RepID=UPI00341332DC